MVTLVLFLIGVLSMITLDPIATAYLHNEPSTVWRIMTIFTHMVSHGSWDHLMGNFLFGGPYLLYLEHKLKDTKKFVRAFVMFGLSALSLQIIFEQFSIFNSVGVIGSSGAIFGVVGAALMLPKSNKIVNLLAKTLLIFFIYSQASSAKLSLVWPVGIAYAAHLGGLLAGVVFSLRHRPRRRR